MVWLPDVEKKFEDMCIRFDIIHDDVFSAGRAANQTSSGVLDGLKALQVDISNTSQQRVAVVQPGVDKRLYQCTNSVICGYTADYPP